MPMSRPSIHLKSASFNSPSPIASKSRFCKLFTTWIKTPPSGTRRNRHRNERVLKLPATGRLGRTVPSNYESSSSRDVRRILVKCAYGAAKSKTCLFHGCHKALTICRGHKKVIFVTDRRLLRFIYSLHQKPCHDSAINCEAPKIQRNASRWTRMRNEHNHLYPENSSVM